MLDSGGRVKGKLPQRGVAAKITIFSVLCACGIPADGIKRTERPAVFRGNTLKDGRT